MIKRLNPLKQVRYKSANVFRVLENLTQQICRFVERGRKMTKGRGFLGLAPKTTFLVQILEIVFDKI